MSDTASQQHNPAQLYCLPDGKALVLRTCNAELQAHGGFQWPESGPVSCPDWDPKPKCGNGLHGLLWGQGDGDLVSWNAEAKWMVVEVEAAACVELSGKVKFPSGTVIFCGDRLGATALVAQHAPAGTSIVGGTATAGTWGTATAGYSGTATAGDRGTATAGDSGTATAGDRGTATAGYSGTATAGDRGTATAGDEGTATAGDRGTATAGTWGTATAGDRGTATAGDKGTATAGTWGTATAGDRGTATAGYSGEIVIRWWDAKHQRTRSSFGYIGEDGLLPGVAYTLDDDHKFVPADEQ